MTSRMKEPATAPLTVRPDRPLRGSWIASTCSGSEQELRAARREGYDEGFAAGAASTADEMTALRGETARLRDETFRSLLEKETELVREAERILPRLALEVARRLVSGVEFTTENVKARVLEVLSEVAPEGGEVEVKLSPGDYKLIEPELDRLIEREPRLRVSPDATLESGDCVAKGRFGAADARLKTRWKVLGELLEK